ncbi:MAG: hypothetical protein WDN66_04790 [Candidatus Saccharibacteria bacterium]
MAAICPTITVSNEQEYLRQLDNVKDFATRLHIDLMDGQLAPTKSISADKIYWPDNIEANIHVMYQQPMDLLNQLVKLKPSMVIIHAEAEVEHQHFAIHLRDNGIKAGLAVLQNTSIDSITDLIPSFDQVLIFGGNLGYQGAQADLSMLDKVVKLRASYPDLEIAWDGGVNDQNVKQIVEAGVSVINVGSYIQASSSPKDAYDKLLSSLS